MTELVTRISDAVVLPPSGGLFDIYVRARLRPDGTWEGLLEFTPREGGETLSTRVETTQPSAEAVTYWATGLGRAFLEGAFVRAVAAKNPRDVQVSITYGTPTDPDVRLAHVRTIERHVLDIFRALETTRLPANRVFELSREYSNADLVRAFEDMEKHSGVLVRRTEGGTDWLHLTTNGAELIGLALNGDRTVERELPRTRA